jgi:Zn-dependent peptidase ImmA (M78 family)
LVEETEPQPIDFIAAATMDDPVAELVRRIMERLNFSLAEFRRQATVDAAFSYLRTRIEDAGVYVLLLGNLGSHHTNISVETFRGLAIADPVAPFIVINDQDARAAWSFTALHEVTHLWLGTTGVSGASVEARIERYCNDVAGELLLPAAEIGELSDLRRAPLASIADAISAFAARRKISRSMVAYKLLRADVIMVATWRELTDRFRQEWIASRAGEEAADNARSSGPNYYVVRRHRLGNALLDTVRRSLGDGSLTHTRAARVLGVKPRNVEPLLYGNPAPGGR